MLFHLPTLIQWFLYSRILQSEEEKKNWAKQKRRNAKVAKESFAKAAENETHFGY